MGYLRDALTAAGDSSARFQIEASRAVFRDWRRALLVVALVLPIIVVPIVAGAGIPDAIGGKHRYGPSTFSPDLLLGTIAIGLVAGLIAGSTGAGGGFVVTPALMSLGIKGILAVGTDMLYLFANALVGTAIHRKLGNVNVRLAIAFTIGSMTGVTFGGMANRALYQLNPVISDLVISLSYVVILGFLGFYALNDVLRSRRDSAVRGGALQSSEARQTGLARAVRSIRVPPMIRFDPHIDGGRQISALVVVILGLLVGFVAAILGAGGGFMTFPIFVYGLGISTLTTTGTNILQVVFTAGYGAIGQYAAHGYVIYSLAIAMMLGSLVGVQIGALSTRVVQPALIRAFYATAILAGFVNRLFAVPEDLSRLGIIHLTEAVGQTISTIGTVLFFGLVTLLAIWVLGAFVGAVPSLRQRSAGSHAPGHHHRLVRHPRALAAGVGLILSFYATIAVLSMPILPNGQTGLDWADDLFNSVSKSSSWFLREEAQVVDALTESRITVTMRAPDEEQAALWAALYRRGGAQAQANGVDVGVVGDLKPILATALTDAELVYTDSTDAVRARYGAEPRAVTYGWWSSLKQVQSSLDETQRHQESAVVQSLSRRVLEPAHNYYGTESRALSANAGLIAGVLGLYLLFTAWYGGAIYAVFEGFGLTGAARSHKAAVKGSALTAESTR